MLTNPWNEPILIVDENPHELSLLEQALREIGAEGRMVMLRSCQEAMNYIKGVPPYDDRVEHPFPLVIYIGLNMPDVKGMEFLKWVKADSHCSIIPTVILASNFEDENVKEAYQHGANAFLAMPSTLKDLTQVIRRSMEFWRLCQKPRYVEHC
jgi:CheY-like chemotaxis protein